ncbi:Uma2 family endonuclease [Desulfatirhabdium butyrativorans]|uniref:Uma2 family endonuclease n=1 Tax=Desulfatirhabdium butyrativorans TaxID=340467 RepID=UPI00042A0483|nr:Uma2 family endonuclease [Desulfatirhabdium butyrativorans]
MKAVRKFDEKRYSYADYLQWHDEERYELIDGEPVLMSPAPNRAHQTISRNLEYHIFSFLQDRSCHVFDAPFDVRLEPHPIPDEASFHVVQPDIVVVCDPAKLDDHGCIGAPDWVIEIVSPSTASKDHIIKRQLYEQFGVREYWIVQPLDKILLVYRLLADGKYGKPDVYCSEDAVTVGILPELKIDLREVFRDLPS